MKTCSKCGIEKLLSEFNVKKANKDGFNGQCKICIRQWSRAYYSINADKRNQQTKDWNKSNPISRENTRLKFLYGISIDTYDQMLKEQSESCKICGIKQKDVKIKFGVDHSHSTGKIRGLLCSKCNHGLGLFNDNSIILEKAAAYVITNS